MPPEGIGSQPRSGLPLWWERHGARVLRGAVLVMAAAVLVRLGYDLPRLLWGTRWTAATDLKALHRRVHDWFAGRPAYVDVLSGYPPASLAILWPLLGWLPVTPARWLWAVTSMAALGWLAVLVIRASGAQSRLERLFVGLLPFAVYPTGSTLGNGHLIVHLLPPLVASLTLLQRRRRPLSTDLLAAGLLVFALAKPTVSVPFFWIALFAPAGVRPAGFTVVAYGALTLLAASFQGANVFALLRSWLASGSKRALRGGYGNLHAWLGALGLGAWILPASFVTLVALGIWIYRHRHRDLWLLLGVTALVARLWTYHRVYDDLLILLPMVSLFRIAKRRELPAGHGVTAIMLLGITWVTMVADARLFLFSPPWDVPYEIGAVTLWIAVLGFLLIHAREATSAGTGSLTRHVAA